MKQTLFNALRIVCMILICTVAGYTQTTGSFSKVRVTNTLS